MTAGHPAQVLPLSTCAQYCVHSTLYSVCWGRRSSAAHLTALRPLGPSCVNKIVVYYTYVIVILGPTGPSAVIWGAAHLPWEAGLILKASHQLLTSAFCFLSTSVADLGCLSRIREFVHPGSRILPRKKRGQHFFIYMKFTFLSWFNWLNFRHKINFWNKCTK